MSDTDWPPAAGFQTYAPPTRPCRCVRHEEEIAELRRRIEALEREANENGWAHK